MYINNMNNNRKELLEIGNKTIDKFPERPLAYLFVSMAYLQEEKYAKALEKLEKGQDLAQGTTLESQFNIFLGDAYYYTGNFEKSKDIFETILESDPDNIPVKNNYSYYLSIEGQNLKKAQKMSKSTILAEPDNPTYLDTYAWILFKRKKYEEALQYIEKAYQNGGNDSEEILEHYIEILKKLNFEKKSEQINNELLKLKDED
jgi:Tfp pilus assembly protein PilF